MGHHESIPMLLDFAAVDTSLARLSLAHTVGIVHPFQANRLVQRENETVAGISVLSGQFLLFEWRSPEPA